MYFLWIRWILSSHERVLGNNIHSQLWIYIQFLLVNPIIFKIWAMRFIHSIQFLLKILLLVISLWVKILFPLFSLSWDSITDLHILADEVIFDFLEKSTIKFSNSTGLVLCMISYMLSSLDEILELFSFNNLFWILWVTMCLSCFGVLRCLDLLLVLSQNTIVAKDFSDLLVLNAEWGLEAFNSDWFLENNEGRQ